MSARLVSLSARSAAMAEASAAVPIILITITHTDLAEPIRLATDATERLSTDPLRYGVRHQGEVYYYALVGVPLPERGQDAAETVSMVIDIVTPDMAGLAGLVTSPARVDLVQVMSDAPDVVEVAFVDMEMRSASIDTQADTITVEIGRMPRLDEPAQRHRMTPDRFPGLHRR